MGEETIKLVSNHNVILSEDDNSDTVDVKFIICDFDPNANDVSLNRNTIENWLDTLKIKPLVGKIATRFDGKKDFTGHNFKIVEIEDEDGSKIKTVEFDTSAFGSFYDVAIETIDEVEYITASAKLWKRYVEAYKVFKRRVDSGKSIKTSWEIGVKESHQETINGKNVKVVDNGVFLGHCLLGEYVSPAYDKSGVIEVSSYELDDELVNALSQDIVSLSEITNENTKVSNKGGNKDMGKDKNKELASLTDNDLYSKVRKAINNFSDDWFYISQLYPYEYKAVAYNWDRESESDFVEFIYTVNSDETISITSQKDVKLKFIPVDEIDSQVSELQTKLSEAEKEIAEAGKSLTELSKEKESLETQVSELTPFKEKVEEMQLAELEKELASKKDELKAFMLEDDLITSEELETDKTLVTLFSELTLKNYETSQEKIEVIKGRKAIQKFKENKTASTEVETSQTKEPVNTKTDLNNAESDGVLTARDIVMSMLKK